jgi:hypothetical protein
VRGARSVAVAASTVVLAAVTTMVATAGGARSLAANRSVYFTSPAPMEVVSAPFTVDWRGPTGPGHRYALFIDLSPVAPGQSLRTLATSQCQQQAACQPTTAYLEGVGVFVTSTDHVSVPALQPLSGPEGAQRHPVHTATLVELTASGLRAGDQAWQVQFRA